MSATVQMQPQEFAVCMATDAFRICLGMKPRNFTMPEIIRWMQTISAA